MKFKKILSLLIFSICALLILGLGVLNDIFLKKPGFFTLKRNYDSHFWNRNAFLEISALYHKSLGVKELNETVDLGEVAYLVDKVYPDIEQKAANLKLLEKAVDKFAFVFLPSIIRSDYERLEPFMFGEEKANVVAFENALREENVPYLDMADSYKDWPIEDRFFHSDHHWKPLYAFACSYDIARHCADMLGISLDEEKFKLENYNIEVLEKNFLGAIGKRVGRFFTGLDDIDVFSPKYETDFSLDGRIVNRKLRGDFETVFLDLETYRSRDYYNSNPYKIYTGDDINNMTLVNHKANNDKRVMILVDSFSYPLIPMLSQAFAEIFVVDLRYSPDLRILEEIEKYNPDMLLVQYSHYALRYPVLFDIR